VIRKRRFKLGQAGSISVWYVSERRFSRKRKKDIKRRAQHDVLTALFEIFLENNPETHDN